MIEELRLITELFKSATDNALYAFLAYGVFNLLKLSIITFPVYKGFTFLVDRMFVKQENSNE